MSTMGKNEWPGCTGRWQAESVQSGGSILGRADGWIVVVFRVAARKSRSRVGISPKQKGGKAEGGFATRRQQKKADVQHKAGPDQILSTHGPDSIYAW